MFEQEREGGGRRRVRIVPKILVLRTLFSKIPQKIPRDAQHDHQRLALAQSRTNCYEICHAFGFSRTIDQAASTLYADAEGMHFLKGRQPNLVAAACVYVSARFFHAQPILLLDVADVSGYT